MLISYLIDIVFPLSCLGCGTVGSSLCTKCLNTADPPHDNLPDWISAIYSYKHPLIKTAIWRLKYKYTYDLGKIFGERMHEALIEEVCDHVSFEHTPIYLVPIPISKKRTKERGYNQALLISNAILSRDRTGMFADGSHFLQRREMTSRQSHTKNKSERLVNIKGSFIQNKQLPKRARIAIIDDVVTTGATLEEARAVLVSMGARTVSALTVAH